MNWPSVETSQECYTIAIPNNKLVLWNLVVLWSSSLEMNIWNLQLTWLPNCNSTSIIMKDEYLRIMFTVADLAQQFYLNYKLSPQWPCQVIIMWSLCEVQGYWEVCTFTITIYSLQQTYREIVCIQCCEYRENCCTFVGLKCFVKIRRNKRWRRLKNINDDHAETDHQWEAINWY